MTNMWVYQRVCWTYASSPMGFMMGLVLVYHLLLCFLTVRFSVIYDDLPLICVIYIGLPSVSDGLMSLYTRLLCGLTIVFCVIFLGLFSVSVALVTLNTQFCVDLSSSFVLIMQAYPRVWSNLYWLTL